MRLRMTVVLALLVPVVWTLVPLHTGRTAVAQSEPSDSDCRNWERAYGGSGNDFGQAILSIPGEGYVLVGTTDEYGHGTGDSDIWLFKTDLNGNKLWERVYGRELLDIGQAIQRTSDGGFAILGASRLEGDGPIKMRLIKTDQYGDMKWSRVFGLEGDYVGVSLQCTTDGGYAVLLHGATPSDGYDVCLTKHSPSGHLEWQRWYGDGKDEWACCVQETTDGGYVLLAITLSSSVTGGAYWIIKTDSVGNTEWSQILGRVDEYRGGRIIQAEDGGFVVIGQAEDPTSGDLDAWLARIDADGQTTWTRAFGGDENDEGYCVLQTEDGGLVFAGYTESKGAGGADAWLVRTDAQGNLLWEQTFGGAGDETCDGLVESHGGYALVGLTSTFGSGSNDVWLVQYCCESVDDQAPTSGEEVTSPSPVQDQTEAEPEEISPEPPAGEVTITDEMLAQAIRRALGLGTEDPITETGLADLERLEIFAEGVQDLSALEYAVNLRHLDLFANDVVDISPLSSLTQLEWLDLSENSITDIGSLVANPGLGDGDYIDLTFNLLDLTPGSTAMHDIQTLVDRGVQVKCDPQKE